MDRFLITGTMLKEPSKIFQLELPEAKQYELVPDVVEKDVFFDCVTPALTAYLGASPKKLLEPGRQR